MSLVDELRNWAKQLDVVAASGDARLLDDAADRIAQLEAREQEIASWILSLEGTYREPVVGRVLRDILATVEHRPLDPPEKYPPRLDQKEPKT